MHGLDSPVSPHRVGELLNRLYPGAGDEVAAFNADFALNLLLRLDQSNGTQFFPAVAHRFIHPGDVGDKGRSVGFESAMILFRQVALLHVDGAKIKRRGGIEELNDGLGQILLVEHDEILDNSEYSPSYGDLENRCVELEAKLAESQKSPARYRIQVRDLLLSFNGSRQ